MYSVPNYIFTISAIALCVIVYVSSSSIFAVGVALTLIAIAVYVSSLLDSPIFPDGWNLTLVPVGIPGDSKTMASIPAGTQEVFHISGNKYTYDDAPAVCAVYNAELATYDQVAQAFAKGAEWCGYGWTLGGMGLYPTQEATWQKLQQEVDTPRRTRCGHPGVNGGYFDTSTKFGVNCYGTKPNCNNRKYPIPIDGEGNIDPDAVNKYKGDSGKIKVSPFNRSGWSMWGMLA